MKKQLLVRLVPILALLTWVTTAPAVPIISIDLNPGLAGIQTTLTVDPGDTFTVDVVLTGDGTTVFDAFAFAADFNDSGAVLGLAPPAGPFAAGLPTAGSIAATAPFPPALDAFSAAAVVPGSPLTSSGVPFPITPGFTASSDGVGMLSIILPFAGPIPAGTTIDLFSLTFDALASGVSTLLPSAGVIPPALGGLALGGAPVPFTLASGTVTVTGAPAAVPAPFTLLLLSTGLLGLAGWRRRKQL